MRQPWTDDDPERPLRRWESLVERRIREAVEAGEYDHLPGRGRPQNLRVDPHVDPAVRLGNDLLRGNGFSLPFVEAARELDRDRDELLRELRLADRMRRAWSGDRMARTRRDATWGAAVSRFRRRTTELNRRIRDHNLTVPVPGMRREPLDADAELARLSGGVTRREG